MVYLKHHEIDFEKWDALVTKSGALAYNYSWYLNPICPLWGAVVEIKNNVYLSGLAVPIQRKWGFTYISQPYFCQQLGFMSLTNSHIDGALIILKDRFLYASRYFIGGFYHEHLPVYYTHLKKIKADVDHSKTYGFGRKDNLKRALKFEWDVRPSTDLGRLIALHQQHNEKKANQGRSVATKAYLPYLKLYETLMKAGKAQLYLAFKNDVCHAGCLFLKSNQRWIYIFNGASAIGRKHHARLLIIHQFFNKIPNCTFDFEDPISAPEVSQYYASFGCEKEAFYDISWINSVFIQMALKLKKAFYGYK